jgi:hypothetical protein
MSTDEGLPGPCAPHRLNAKDPRDRLWLYAQWCRAQGAVETAVDIEDMVQHWKQDQVVIQEARELRKSGIRVDAAFFGPARHDINFEYLEPACRELHEVLYTPRGALREAT